MAVGTYNLPICDGCKLPWLPVGWTQDSDPRNTAKPLRCGKCKSIGWDREFVKAEKIGNVAQTDRAHAASDAPEVMPLVATQVGEVAGSTPAVSTKTSVEDEVVSEIRKIFPASRCKHRMTDCPICHPKEAA